MWSVCEINMEIEAGMMKRAQRVIYMTQGYKRSEAVQKGLERPYNLIERGPKQ